MSWVQMVLAVPALAFVAALVHDFLAGLGEERQWSDPVLDDPHSFAYRSSVAGLEPEGEVTTHDSSGLASTWDLLVPVPQA